MAAALVRSGAIATPPSRLARSGSPVRAALVVGLLALAARTATAAPTAAGDVPEKARVLAERGKSAHASGDYNTAISAYTEAYAIAPSPALLFNLAQAYRLRGSCDDAALMYRRYLATSPSADARAIAEDHLSTVERCAHKVALQIPLDAAERAAVPAVARQQDAARERPGETQQRVGIGIAIGGGLALVAAGYFALEAMDAESDLEKAYAAGGSGRDLVEIDERGERSATLATWLGIGGGALVVGGVTTYLLGRHAEAASRVAIKPRAGGAEVSFAWRF